ncbi:D(1A) dopamine receptor-like [Ptychodera flava]|uniref:D(1A) dopamine receptor-like n=1 Tax=Ptychodera flava TaxID=63121 RepID=UPI00396A6EAB
MTNDSTNHQVTYNCCNLTNSALSPDYAGAVLMLTLSCIIVWSNSLIAVAILSFRKLRGSNDYIFVLSLSVCDILVGLVYIPLEVVPDIVRPFPMICTLTRGTQVLLQTVNLLNVVIITLNKYIKIFHPFRYPFWVTKRTQYVAVALIWNFPVVWATYATVRSLQLEDLSTPKHCFQYKPPQEVTVSLIITGFLLPAVILIICNLRIALLVRKQHLRIASLQVSTSGRSPGSAPTTSQPLLTKKELRAVRLVTFIAITFLLFWCPVRIIFIVTSFCKDCIERTYHITVYAIRLCHLNSAINPLLYSLDRPLRIACKKLLKRQAGPLIVPE